MSDICPTTAPLLVTSKIYKNKKLNYKELQKNYI